MTGFSSYPRTSGHKKGESVPKAAYANVPEPLRSRLIAATRHHREAFHHAHPGLEFLVPAYVDESRFKGVFREDNEGRLFPEPGAQPGTMSLPSWRLHPSVDPGDPDLANLLKQISTFAGEVQKSTHLSNDDVVWRFVGANYTARDASGAAVDKYFCNRLGGDFWGVGSIPQTEAEWRAMCAIPGIWNGDGGYIAFRVGDLPPEIQEIFRSGLIGTVGPQPSMVHDHYLAGGGSQLVVDPYKMLTVESYFFGAEVHRSAWNQ